MSDRTYWQGRLWTRQSSKYVCRGYWFYYGRGKQLRALDKNQKEQIYFLMERYPRLESIKQDIIDAYYIIDDCYDHRGKLLIAGNGGSAADSEHIVGELMKGFRGPRAVDEEFAHRLMTVNPGFGEVLARKLQKALPAIALTGHFALTSAYMNDVEPLLCFAQQVNGFGNKGDVFLGISTSGNSKNILYAAAVAKAKSMKVIGLTGDGESELDKIADVCIKVPEKETYMVQELHLPIYHCLCLMLEEGRFNGKNK